MVHMYKIGNPCANSSVSSSPKLNSNNNIPNITIIKNPKIKLRDEATATAAAAASSMFTLAIGSWLRSRRSRLLFLLLCSPVLLPILFACFPVLCAVEVCIRICRRRMRKPVEEESLRRCEEGCCGCGEEEYEERELGLLQRYLEDQLMLVGSVYDCADHDDDDDEDQVDYRAPLLS